MQDMLPTDVMGSEADIARAMADNEEAAARGFGFGPTAVRFGIEVVPDGQARYRQSHALWEKMAPAGKALDSLSAAVAREQRTDQVLHLREIKMAPTGEVLRKVGFPDPCGGEARHGRLLPERAWRQFTALEATVKDAVEDDGEEGERRRVFPAQAGLYLADPATPRVRRAQDINYHLGRAPQHAKVLLRGRTLREEEQLWAILGPRYNRECDADKAAALIKRHLPATGARGEMTYQDGRWSVDLLWHSRLLDHEKVVAGEVFQGGIRVTSADNGTERLRVKRALRRNSCRNFIIIDVAEVEVGSTHHNRKLAQWLVGQLRAANEALAPFVERWNLANQRALLDASRTDPGEAFGKLVETGLLVTPPGYSDKDFVDRLVAAHSAEGGYSAPRDRVIRIADATNAVSRAAHENAWSSPWIQQDLEEQAGQLLYQKVVWHRAPLEID